MMANSHLDQTNTLKLFRLINELGTEALKITFDAAHPPVTLKTMFSKQDVMKKLTVLLRKGVLHQDQWDKIYPCRGIPSSKDFDISLLFVLLRNVCGMLAANDPKWTSEPTTIFNDQSPEANITRIRWYRNDIVHNRVRGINKVTFDDYWRSISTAVVSLGVDIEDVEDLKHRPLDEEFYMKMLLERKTEEQNLKDVKRCLSKNEEELQELSQAVRALEEEVRRTHHRVDANDPEEWLKNLAKMDFTGDINFNLSRYHPNTRQWVFEAFEQWYNNNDSDSKVFLVTGNPGMGKSVIAGVICKRLENAKCLGGAFFCQYGNLRCRSARFLLQSIAHSLCNVLPEYKEWLLKDLSHNLGQTIERMSTEELFVELLQGPLNKISAPAQYLVIVIDGLDECEYDSKNEILRLISLKFPRLPQWLKFVVTSRPEMNVIERLQILKPVVLQQEDGKNVDDIRSFVRSKLSPLFKSSNDLEQSVDAVTQKAQGLMLLAYFLVTFVQHTGKANMTFDDIRHIYPKGISSVFEDYLCHFLNDLEGYPRQRVFDFLSAVAAARAPLPVTVLAKVLEEGDGRPSSRRKSLGKVIDSVSILLPVVNGHIHVFHKSFTDWLSTTEGHVDEDYSVDIKEGHRILGEICQEAFKDAKKTAHFEESCPLIAYALQHGVHHLLQLADPVEARRLVSECITDLELIHAKLLCPYCPFHSVIEEMLLAKDVLFSEHDPEVMSRINDCLNVLKRHASILSGDPSLFYQFIVNKAEDRKIVEDAKLCIQQNCKGIPWIQVYNKAAYQGPIRASNNCSSFITAADVSVDEDMVALRCSNGAVVLWSLRTARQVWIRYSETQSTNCCLFAPDGSYIIFGFLSSVYSLSGDCIALFPKITMEFEDCIFQAPENKKILTLDCYGAINVWDSTNGNRLAHRVLRFGVCCCKFSLCGRFIVAVTSQELYLLFSNNCTNVKRVQLAGSPLVQPKLVCVSLLGGGTALLLFENHEIKCAFSIQGNGMKSLNLPKDLRILGTARNGSFAFLDEATRPADCDLPFPVVDVPDLGGLYSSSVTATDVNSSSCLAWVGSTFFLFNISKGAEEPATQEQAQRLIITTQTNEESLLFSSSGERMIVTDLRGQQKELRAFEDFGTFCLLPSTAYFIVSQRGRMRKTSWLHRQEEEEFQLPIERYIWDLRFLNERCILIVARLVTDWFDTCLLVFDTHKWQVETTTEGNAIKIFSIDIFSGGKQVITSDEAGTIVIWNTKPFSMCTKADTDFEEGLSVCKCSPDGKLVASFAIGGKRINLWQSHSLQLVRTLELPTQCPVLACGFPSSSDYFVSLGQDRVLRIWSTKNGQTVSMMEFDHRPRLLAICPQTNNLAVSLDSGKVLLGAVHLPWSYLPHQCASVHPNSPQTFQTGMKDCAC